MSAVALAWGSRMEAELVSLWNDPQSKAHDMLNVSPNWLAITCDAKGAYGIKPRGSYCAHPRRGAPRG